MHGRGESLAELARQVERARGGKRIALVAGEAGIGKTRLVAEFAARAYADGAIVLYGRSNDLPDAPYAPFAEALDHYLKHASAAAPEYELRELELILPGRHRPTAPPAVGASSGIEQFQLFASVASVLERVADDGTVVLVLDDLHWADDGTLLLLRQLMMRPAEVPLLVVGTYRPTDVAAQSALAETLAQLTREPQTARVELGSLSREDAVELIGGVAGHALSGPEVEFASALHRESAGNPLFLTELLRALLDGGSIRDEEGRWRVEHEPHAASLPSSVKEVIQQRVAALGTGVAGVLSAAAVAGQEFDPDLVVRVLERDAPEAEEAWDAAERAALVVGVERGRVAFNHPLVQRVLYEAVGRRRRGLLHRRFAEAMEDAGRAIDVSETARHWAAAVPAEPAKARLWAARAGRQALDRFDGSAAADWYRHALDLHERSGAGDDRARAELLVGLGAAQRHAGDPDFRETLLCAWRLAERVGAGSLMVEAALLTNRGFASASGQIDDERVAILEATLRAVGRGNSRERALLLATLAVELTFSGEWERRAAMSDEAVAIARRLGDRVALAHAITLRFVPIWMPETLEERLANTLEAVRVADELGDPWVQFHAVRWRFVALMQSGELAEATTAGHREQELAQRLGDPTTRWMSTYDRGTLAVIAARLDEAEELANEGAAVAKDSGPRDGLPMFTSLLTNIRYEQGRLSELQPLLAGVVAENPGIPAFRAILALAYVEADLVDEARNLLAIDAKTGFAEVPADPSWLAAHALYGHVAAAVADRSAAAALYARLAPWHEQVVYAGVGAWGYVDHALGRLATTLGRFEDAQRHLDAALDRATRFGAPVWVARAQLDTARMLLARDWPGDRDCATGPLEQAISGAARAGAETVERRARSLREHQRALDIAAAAGQTGQRLRVRAVPAITAGRSAVAPAGRLELRGDYWALGIGDTEVRLRDSKGVQYLARLLASPEVEMHALDLQAGGAWLGSTSSAAATDADLAVRAAGADDPGSMLDTEAKRHYRERIEELRGQIDEAERFNDPERASRARAELDFVARELSSAVGIGGRDRKLASEAERARVNVTRAIRTTIKRIADYDGRIAGHLEASVRTGAFCSYRPPAGQAVEWTVGARAAG